MQVLKGLQPGDVVVIDGADKLKDGGKVSVVTPQDIAASTAGSGQHHHFGNGQHHHGDGWQGKSGSASGSGS